MVKENLEMSEKIIKVVSMRKEMEKVLELEALQSTHSETITKLIDQKVNLQGHSSLLEEKIKVLDDAMISSRLEKDKVSSKDILSGSAKIDAELKVLLREFRQTRELNFSAPR